MKNYEEWLAGEINRIEAEKMKRIVSMSTSSPDFKRFTFTNFLDRVGTKQSKEAAVDFVKKYDRYKAYGIGLILSGEYGNGKSHLQKAITNNLVSKGIPCMYIEFQKIFENIQSTYGKDEKQRNELFKIYQEVEVLSIDDIGVGKWSDDKEDILLKIINPRIDNKRLIIATLNPEAEMKISGRVISRLTGMCQIVRNYGTDYRAEELKNKLGA